MTCLRDLVTSTVGISWMRQRCLTAIERQGKVPGQAAAGQLDPGELRSLEGPERTEGVAQIAAEHHIGEEIEDAVSQAAHMSVVAVALAADDEARRDHHVVTTGEASSRAAGCPSHSIDR